MGKTLNFELNCIDLESCANICISLDGIKRLQYFIVLQYLQCYTGDSLLVPVN